MGSRRRHRLVYSVTEAAELLGIGRSTAYDLVARGELETVRLGGRVVVTRPTLTELIGVEPPLPYELDAHHDVAVPDSATRSDDISRLEPRTQSRTRADQSRLPFPSRDAS